MNGNSMDKAVEMFSVSKGSISGWVTEFKNTGRIEKKIQDREHLRKITPQRIDEFLAQNPYGDQQEMASAFCCTNQSVSDALRKFGYSKKNSVKYIKSPTL